MGEFGVNGPILGLLGPWFCKRLQLFYFWAQMAQYGVSSSSSLVGDCPVLSSSLSQQHRIWFLRTKVGVLERISASDRVFLLQGT